MNSRMPTNFPITPTSAEQPAGRRIPAQLDALLSTADPDALLTEGQAAQLLNLSIRTLQAWRLRGGGPAYLKLGRSVRYCRSGLMEYIAARQRKSTSDPGRAADASAPAEG